MATVLDNPFGQFRAECTSLLKEALARSFPEIYFPCTTLSIPPSSEYGDLSSSILLEASKRIGKKPLELVEKLAPEVHIEGYPLIESVNFAGAGYINFHARYALLSKLTIESAKAKDVNYGCVQADKPIRVIVEHTSINPAGPIHVGTGRNSVIGDSIARLLKTRGHQVTTHFYVDDVGRQIAVLAYGYRAIGCPKPEGKPDHWIGLLYAITNCVLEIRNLNQQIKDLESSGRLGEELDRIRHRLDDWVSVAAELREKNPSLFDDLTEAIRKDHDPDLEIARIMQEYETQNPQTVSLLRTVVNLCLEGFRETYDRIGICWDSWDWESDFVWSGKVADVIMRLRSTQYSMQKMGALAINVNAVAEHFGLKKLFGISESFEIPPLVLMRSDGTTLYPTRDIAYSLWKLERADRVINVIGIEQTLPQLQLRIALSLLVSPQQAMNIIHYAHELVNLPGYKMSKRKGRFIALDDILDEAEKKAREEVDKRSPDLEEDVKRAISKIVGSGAVKFALLDVAPSKPVTFTWDRVLNFETNSAPFVQYAHARACSILRKVECEVKGASYELLTESIERELVRRIASFPEDVVTATESLSPSIITNSINEIASKFNSFYASLPVLKANPEGLMAARLGLVDSVRITLRNGLSLLGIEAPTRM
ncbi:MAG: arginine--tRNA ligase [Candidatus Bathyarchaeia archaeon]